MKVQRIPPPSRTSGPAPAVPSSERQRSTVKPLHITVLMGGPSAEREVSLKSGQAVADALASLGHAVQCSDISYDDLSALDAEADVLFIALHGAFGEDGQLQRILERRGLPFCGSGSEASALAMDKVASKRKFAEVGIPTPRFDVATAKRLPQALACWSLPVVIKPTDQGSSVGCHIVGDHEALRERSAGLMAEHGSFLIEEFVRGRELTVGILGDQTLPIIEIRPRREFYDYDAKYIDDDTEYVFDPDVSGELRERVERLSLVAHRALGCRDFSRVDWMIDECRDEAFALEVNTIPGFTDHSLLPKAAERAGIGFAELCNRIVDLALDRPA